MVVRKVDGYAVFSHKGKRLSKKKLTRRQAKNRLREIEYFKHRRKKRND